jgi:hypothetical protein
MPSKPFDQYAKILDMQKGIMDQFPTSGHLPAVVGTLMMAGRTQDAQKAITVLAQNFPSKGGIEAYERERSFNWDKQKHSDAMKMDRERIGMAKEHFDRSWAANQLQAFRQMEGAKFDDWWRIMSSKDSSSEDKETAQRGLADSLAARGVPVTIEQVRRWYWPFSTDPVMKMTNKGKESVGAVMGATKAPKDPFGEENGNYWKEWWEFAKKLPGFTLQALTGSKEE